MLTEGNRLSCIGGGGVGGNFVGGGDVKSPAGTSGRSWLPEGSLFVKELFLWINGGGVVVNL